MANIKVNELARELGIKNNDLMSYLREKGVDAKSVTSLVDDKAIAIAESFFGKRKIKHTEPKTENKSSKLFYQDGSLVRTKDADGNPLPITGPVFDEEGNLKKLPLDKNGFRIKPTKDENGNINVAVYSYTKDGRLVRLAKKADTPSKEAEPKKKEEAPAKAPEKAEENKAEAVNPVEVKEEKEPVKEVSKPVEEKVIVPVVTDEKKPVTKTVNTEHNTEDKKPVSNRDNNKSNDTRKDGQ